MSSGRPDIEIKVGSSADTKGLREAEKGIKDLTGAAATLGGGPGGGAGSGGVLGGLAGGFNKLTAALGGVAVAVGAAKKAWSEYAAAEQDVFRLDSALAQRGHLNKEYRESLQTLAGEMQNLTAIADGDWVATIARLTQFGIGPDRMRETIEMVKNVAGIYGGDLRTATEAVTRALNGNYTAFTRLGIAIPETASELEKFQAAAKAAAEIGGGQLEAMGKGAAGQMKQLQNAMSDTFKALGRLVVVTGIIDAPLNRAKRLFEMLSNAIGGTIDQAEGMQNVFQRTKIDLEQNAYAAERYAKALEKVNKEAAARSRDIDKEGDALGMVKRGADELARTELDETLKIIDARNLPDAQKQALKEKATRQFEAGQYRGDQMFRTDQQDQLERLIANEDANVAAAKAQLDEARAATKTDANISAEFERLTSPVRAEIAELEKLKQYEIKATGFRTSQRVKDVEAKIAEKNSQIQSITDSFNSANPPVNPELQVAVSAAQRNFDEVSARAADRKYGFQERLGRTRFEYDIAEQTQAMKGAGQVLSTPGVFDEAQRGNFQPYRQAMQKENPFVGQFDTYSNHAAQVMGRAIGIIENMARKLDQIERQYRVLESRYDNMRNR